MRFTLAALRGFGMAFALALADDTGWRFIAAVAALGLAFGVTDVLAEESAKRYADKKWQKFRETLAARSRWSA